MKFTAILFAILLEASKATVPDHTDGGGVRQDVAVSDVNKPGLAGLLYAVFSSATANLRGAESFAVGDPLNYFDNFLAENGNQGYCQPWGNQGGDLCREQKKLDVCSDCDGSYYLPYKSYAEVASKCLEEPECKGFTWDTELGKGKLKSTVDSVFNKNSRWKCFKKQEAITNQKCGGVVDYTSDLSEACQTYLWDPTGDSTMHCFAHGRSSDPCHLSNKDDDDGINKDPSKCFGDTLYLWDEPHASGGDLTSAGATWLDYSKTFAQELKKFRYRGGKVTGPLLKADSGVGERNMRTFYTACGSACVDPADPAYIDIIAFNAYCEPSVYHGCRFDAKRTNDQAVSASRAFYNLPVYITTWTRGFTWDPIDQVEAIDVIDEFFPASDGVVERVYWLGTKDPLDWFGMNNPAGAEKTGYLTNVLQDGKSLGELWRAKCDSIE